MPVKYDLVQHESGYHDEHWAIKIMEGDLEGVVFQYDTVSVEEKDQEEAILHFDILYIENEDKVTDAEAAKTIFGDILVSIIEEHASERENGNGNSNTETPSE